MKENDQNSMNVFEQKERILNLGAEIPKFRQKKKLLLKLSLNRQAVRNTSPGESSGRISARENGSISISQLQSYQTNYQLQTRNNPNLQINKMSLPTIQSLDAIMNTNISIVRKKKTAKLPQVQKTASVNPLIRAPQLAINNMSILEDI